MTNTILVARVNYQLSFMFGLKEKDFAGMQRSIDKFIFNKKIFKGKGKYCSKKVGGLGSPKLYERFLTAQLSWLRKCVQWSKAGGDAPLWFLPFKALLKKYWLPQCHYIVLMGRAILDVVAKLCLHEGLFVMGEILNVLLDIKKKMEMKLIWYLRNPGGETVEHLSGVVGATPWLGSRRLRIGQVMLRAQYQGRPPDLLGSAFLENIIKGRLQFFGKNVDEEGNGVANIGLELVEGSSESLMRECRKEIGGAILEYARRGLVSKRGVKLVRDPLVEYICYGGKKPTSPVIDFRYRRDNHVINKWDGLELGQMIPINREILNRALCSIPKCPPEPVIIC